MNILKIISILLALGSSLLSLNIAANEQSSRSEVVNVDAASANNTTCVILLHGIARTHLSMFRMESTLKNHHYIVVNRDYPANRKSVDILANQFIPPMVDECLKQHAKHIDFVTHSIGGVVVQQYLQQHPLPQLRYIVMLGPPNHGSPLVNMLHQSWLIRFIMGPAGEELTTEKKPTQLDHQHYKIGVIAGSFSLNPFGNLIFHEPNDGKVGVSSTKIDRMDDFITVPSCHTFIMMSSTVINQVLHFLENGKFIH